MKNKEILPGAFEDFYKYEFDTNHTSALKWSQNGNTLGWLMHDGDTRFLHIWNRVNSTYDAIEISDAKDFSFPGNDQYILVLTENSKISELHIPTLTIVKYINPNLDRATLISCSPNGKLLAVASQYGDVKVFNSDRDEIYSGTIERSHRNGRAVVSLSLSWDPSSKYIASAGIEATVVDVFRKTQTRYISDSGNYQVIWSPDGRWLAAASTRPAVIIWDVASETILRILEGHKTPVRSVSFSYDGSTLASQSMDGDLIFWNCADWSSVQVEDGNGRRQAPKRALAFHPEFFWLAHVHHVRRHPNRSALILSQVDPELLYNQASSHTVTYTSAKIVLVGESGAGKTGLGWRIANNSFKEHPSTHGQQFWLVDQLSSERADGTQCEAVLWDLAGQPDYRLIHALFLDDVDLALVVFDPTRNDDPLFGVDYWLNQLSSRSLTNRTGVAPPILLVAARTDRGAPRLTDEDIRAFCKARALHGYVATSARTAVGVSDLLVQMRNAIPWEEKPATVTTTNFKRIKDHVLRIKESRNLGQSIISLEELRKYLISQRIALDFAKDELLAAVRNLATHGYVAMLRTSKGESLVLLIPELLNNLAASLVLEARRNLRGLGSLDEQLLLKSKYEFDELASLSPTERIALLDSTVAMLLNNNVCYRETDPLNARSYLVFPELINLKKPQIDDDTVTVDDVSYTVSGGISNVYASLVVLLGYTDRFTRTNQWRDNARYEFSDGMVCGFRLENEGETELEFVLYFGDKVKETAKKLFTSLFENFLSSREVKVQRYSPIRCSNGHQFNRNVIRDQFTLRQYHAFCARCGERVDLNQKNQATNLTIEETKVVRNEERAARQRSVFEKSIYLLKAYTSRKNITPPSCFVSYAWGEPEHERWVERLANDLSSAGINIILDRWDNAQIGASVPRFVERVHSAEKVVVIGTPVYRSKYQNGEPMRGFVVAAEGDLIGVRLIGTEEDKRNIMPILLSGSAQESLPDILKGRVYSDMRDGGQYVTETLKLLFSLYGVGIREPVVSEILNMFEAGE